MVVRIFRGVVAAGVVAVVALGAVAAGWWFFVREDAQLATSPPAIPTGLADATVTAAGAAADGVLAFEVVPEASEAAYFADEELASIGVPSTAKGSTQAISGTFYLAEDGWALDETRASTFTVELATLTSGESRRDSRVQEALAVASHPTATFTVRDIRGVDPTLDPAVEQRFRMTGVLEMRGVQRQITWDVQARREGDVITALATTSFLLSDFSIPPPNIAGFVTVGVDVVLQVQIVARAVEAAG